MSKNYSEATLAHRRAYNKAYSKERRAWLKEHGFCIECGSAYAMAGRSRCRECETQHRIKQEKVYPVWHEKQKARYQYRRENGLCLSCGAPAAEGRRRCKRCLERQRINNRVYVIKQRMEREAQAARERSRA